MTQQPRLTVLGGSSPFTAGFVAALEAASERLPGHDLVLHGRDPERVELLARHAGVRLGRLGWTVRGETDLDRALVGASHVVHQIRYGDLEGRAADEHLALMAGCVPDETLGPAALARLLLLRDDLLSVCERLVAICPDALVLNLTNPLSAVTSLMVEAGVARCIGICELPYTTARRAAERLGWPPDRVTWRYVGLNHRGFIVELEFRGFDGIQAIVAGSRSGFEGVPRRELERLDALPTKYFRLLCERSARGGRATAVAAIRDQALEELRHAPGRSPPSLRARILGWYDDALVPLLGALHGEEAWATTLNLPQPDGITRELQALVSRQGITPLPPPRPRPAILRWLDVFETHERVALEAARVPDLPHIRRALEADPLTPDRAVETASQLLHDRLRAAR